MAIERTFSIIKPDATERNLTGAINAVIEKAGLRIIAQKRIHMTRGQAETFYGVHKARPFFGELVDFMISAPVVVQVLEGDNAIANYREASPGSDKQYPASLSSLLIDTRHVGTLRHLRKLYADPLNPNQAWGLMQNESGRIVGVYSISSDPPLAQGAVVLDDRTLPASKRYSEWKFIALSNS